MLCMCVHLLGIMVMALLLLATSMMTSVAAMTASMMAQLLWFILFASTMLMTMMQQPLLASIIKYIEDGHVVHIEVVITMPQTICVWIQVVTVVHPQHLQGYDALIKMIRLYPNLMPTTMIKTKCT